MNISTIITIPDWHPARLNRLLGHWGASSRLKTADRKMVWAYTRKVPKATLKRRVTVHIHIKGRGRTPDPDAYFKSLLDALVFNEMLVDDGSKWVELAPVLFFRGNEKKTVIILEDMA